MNIKINDNEFKINVCMTPKQITQGMQNKTFDGFEGLLFLLSSGPQSFWMYKCIIPLDILFINNDRIVKIYSNCQPCHNEPCERFGCNLANMVLELPGNTCKNLNIKENDKIDLSFI